MLFATLDPTLRTMKLPRRAARRSCPTPWASSPTCRTNWSRPSAPPWKRCRRPTSILHVRDIATADSEAQAEDVEAVLKQIETPEGKTRRVLEVWNKIDLLDADAREAVLGQAERLRARGQGRRGLGLDRGGDRTPAPDHRRPDRRRPGDRSDARPVPGRGPGLALRARPGHLARHRRRRPDPRRRPARIPRRWGGSSGCIRAAA